MRFTNILLMLLLMPITYSAVEISEIMYNPEDGNEWIEFYTSEIINVTRLKLQDNKHTDEIVCCNSCAEIIENEYLLIVDQGTTLNYSNMYCVDDNSIGNGLGNTGDTIILFSNETYVNFSYGLNVEKGRTISLVNGKWQESVPTPLSENIIFTKPINEPDYSIEFLADKLYQGFEASLFKIKNNAYPAIKDQINITLYYNVSKPGYYEEFEKILSFKSYSTLKHTFKEPGHLLVCGHIDIIDAELDNNFLCTKLEVLQKSNEPCNISLSLETDKTIYEKGEKIKIIHTISDTSFPFEIEYWVEDLFGHYYKNKLTSKNTNKKSFTPKFSEREKSFIIKSKLNAICNNINPNTYAEKLVAVKGAKSNLVKKDTSIKIEKIYFPSDNKYVFGDPVKAKIVIYKGNTRKSAVKLYVEGTNKKVSQVTTFYAHKPNQEYDFTTLIHLNSGCSYKKGKYKLVAEGLDKKVTKSIEIEQDKSCNDKIINKIIAQPVATKSEKLYELLDYSENVTDYSLAIIKINNPGKNHTYIVWSYLYDGPVSLSGDRKTNMQTIELDKYETKLLVLRNDVLDHSQDSKLKIKILRDDRKTPYEITRNITINTKTEPLQVMAQLIEQKTTQSNATAQPETKLTGEVVYESSFQKMKNHSFIFLFIAMLLAGYAWYTKI